MSLLLGFLADHWLAVSALVLLGIAGFVPGGAALLWRFKSWILCAGIAFWGWSGHAAHEALKAENAKRETRDMRQALDDSAALLKSAKERADALEFAAANASAWLGHASKRYANAAKDRPLAPNCAPGQGRVDAVNETLSGREAHTPGEVK